MNLKKPKPGLFLLPNLLTAISLFAAFYSIILACKAQYEAAVFAIFIALIMDEFDGRVARWTHTQSTFGAEFDSLCDMTAFGVAPGILLYSWNLHYMHQWGLVVSFIYTAMVALRLARFNSRLGLGDNRYFQGLPCPPAAAILTAYVLFCHQNNFEPETLTILTAAIAILLAILMISQVPYYTFKEINFKGNTRYYYLGMALVLIVAIIINPAITILTGFGIYALSGPLRYLWLKKQHI